MRYKVITNKEKILKITQSTESKPAQSFTPKSSETKGLESFRKWNDDGFSHLLLSVMSDKDVKTIANATSTTFSTGSLKTAWLKLNRNYKPKTGQYKIKLIQTYSFTYLDNISYPPEDWFKGLNQIRMAYKTSILSLSPTMT